MAAMRSAIPSLVLAGALACAHAPAPAVPGPPGTLREAGPPAAVPLDLARLQQHLDGVERAVSRLPPDKAVPRALVFDAAGGADQQEHARLGNGLLVMVVAVTRDAGELPLRRVRARGPGGAEATLALVGSLPAGALARLRLPAALGSAAGWGGLYFLPGARRTPGPLLADFARNREGMEFGTIGPTVFGALRDVDGARVEPRAVREVAAREFPAAELLPGLDERLAAGR